MGSGEDCEFANVLVNLRNGQSLLLDSKEELENYLENYLENIFGEEVFESSEPAESRRVSRESRRVPDESRRFSTKSEEEIRRRAQEIRNSIYCDQNKNWQINDVEVPEYVKKILKIWYDWYGNINFSRQCNTYSKIGPQPTGVIDFYLTCSHTRERGYDQDSSIDDKTSLLDYFKHIHLIYDYNEDLCFYKVKDYGSLNLNNISKTTPSLHLKILKDYHSTSTNLLRKGISNVYEQLPFSTIIPGDLKLKMKKEYYITEEDDTVETVIKMRQDLDCSDDQKEFRSTDFKQTPKTRPSALDNTEERNIVFRDVEYTEDEYKKLLDSDVDDKTREMLERAKDEGELRIISDQN